MNDQIPVFQGKDKGGRVYPPLCEDPHNSLQYICMKKVNGMSRNK